MGTPLQDLADKINANARAKGFWPEGGRNFGEMLMLATSELSEALEEDRSGHPSVYFDSETHKPEGAAIEIVDCIIRCLDTLKSITPDGYTIDELVEMKMAYNAGRQYMHGRIY